MMVRERQVTSLRFYRQKMEDIIVQGGGNLVIELYNSIADDRYDEGRPVNIRVDGITRTVEAGSKLILSPGDSICIEQRMFHKFYGEQSIGTVLFGEVSQVNTNETDNSFFGGYLVIPRLKKTRNLSIYFAPNTGNTSK